jgi:hypothetical protein
MPVSKEQEQYAARIGVRLREAVAKARPSDLQIEEAGFLKDTFQRKLQGKNVVEWIKLAGLAKALGTTPNYLLDFPASDDRAAPN